LESFFAIPIINFKDQFLKNQFFSFKWLVFTKIRVNKDSIEKKINAFKNTEMKNIFYLLSISFMMCFAFFVQSQEIPWEGKSVEFSHGKLKVSENKRFLEFEDGTPFFYSGDTGWQLFQRLTKEDALKYLENRRQKGFTVIQAVALAELDGIYTPNVYGELSLVNGDPLHPNEKYFQHMDWVIKKAAEKGIFIGLLPTWGDKIDPQWGKGPKVFNTVNAQKYAAWIANRYKDYQNIIWINGGDRQGGGANFAVWDVIGKTIKSIDKNHLMTFHPWGGTSSSAWFQDCEWLDFNMMQTGHAQRSYAIYKQLMIPDYNRQPTKPVLDGEPRYEDHPVNWLPDVLGWFNDADVRQAAYWGVFSGGMGSTYGCHPIWQFYDAGQDPIGLVRHTWKEDLDLPGSWDMLHLRRLMLSRDYLSRVPDQSILSDEYVPETDYIVAIRGNGYALIYTPTGTEINVDIDKLSFTKVNAYWFDPRTGESTFIESFAGTGKKKFKPLTTGRGNDWVLVLDDAKKKYSAPGLSTQPSN